MQNDFLDFMQRNDLTSSALSLVVTIERNKSRHEYSELKKVERIITPKISHLWQHILSNMDVPRIVLLAPLPQLGRLAGCMYAFGHLSHPATAHAPYQILELDRKSPLQRQLLDHKADYGLSSKATEPYHIATSSLLHARVWSRIGLNEGGLYKHYGSGISSVPSLLNYLFPRCCAQSETPLHTHNIVHVAAAMTCLNSFAYTAIFPPKDHLLQKETRTGMHQMHYLRELDLQLAPHEFELERILEEEFTDYAQAERLWHHWSLVIETYDDLAQLLSDSAGAKDWRLRSINCEDRVTHDLVDQIAMRYVELKDCRRFSYRDPWRDYNKTWDVVVNKNGGTEILMSGPDTEDDLELDS